MAVHPLAALIENTQKRFLDEHGVTLSYGSISRRSGGRVTRTRVHQLATMPMRRIPEPETITGLSLGLGVTEDVVLQRCLESAGYRVSEHAKAARFGTPLQVQKDAAAPDENVDRPAGDDPA